MRKFIIGLIVVLAILFVAKDFLMKSAVEIGTQLVTGLPLKIGSLKTDLFKNEIEIKDLKLMNPAGYEEKVMLSIPEIFIASDFMGVLLKGKLHVPEFRIQMDQFNVVKNSKGELNLDRLKALQTATAKKEPAKPAEKAKPMSLQVDTLVLKVGKVSFKDYSKPSPSTNDFSINLDERYENITNLNMVISVIVVKALMHTTIGQLANVDVKAMEGAVTDAMAASKEQLMAAGAKTQAAVTEKGKQLTGATKEKTSQTAGWLKGKLTGGDSK